jgi:hypothetical protein
MSNESVEIFEDGDQLVLELDRDSALKLAQFIFEELANGSALKVKMAIADAGCEIRR